MSDVEEFQAEARNFLETTLPTLTPIPDTGTDRREHVSLFTSRAAELAAVPTARQWRAAKFDAGFGWLTGPREYGGAGLPEEYERHYLEVELDYDVPPEDCFSTGLEGLGQTILAHGSEYLKDLLLRKIFRGDLITCLLFSEPGAGSDLGSVRTRAVRDGDDWVVSGQKVWSSRTHYADVGFVASTHRNRGRAKPWHLHIPRRHQQPRLGGTPARRNDRRRRLQRGVLRRRPHPGQPAPWRGRRRLGDLSGDHGGQPRGVGAQSSSRPAGRTGLGRLRRTRRGGVAQARQAGRPEAASGLGTALHRVQSSTS